MRGSPFVGLVQLRREAGPQEPDTAGLPPPVKGGCEQRPLRALEAPGQSLAEDFTEGGPAWECLTPRSHPSVTERGTRVLGLRDGSTQSRLVVTPN